MMTALVILGVIALAMFGYWLGYESGKFAAELEYKESREYVNRNLAKIDEYENYRAQLKNINGIGNLSAAFTMAFRLMACGVDPKDLVMIDRIGMAFAEGKFEAESDDEFQAKFDHIVKPVFEDAKLVDDEEKKS